MNGDNNKKKSNLVQIVGLTALLGLLGGGAVGFLLWYDKNGDPPEEERPPIIVMNGSAKFTVEYPAETPGKEGKGFWEPAGVSGRYRHRHDLSGPTSSRVSVFNAATCSAGADEQLRYEKWIKLGLRDEAETPKRTTVDLRVLGAYAHVIVTPADVDVAIAQSELTVTLKDATGQTLIESVAGGDAYPGAKCEFNRENQPVIRMEQRRQ